MCDWNYRKQSNAINERIETFCGSEMIPGNQELIEETMKQLDLYFKRELTAFNLPLLLCGTEFQQGVWRDLLAIHYGATLSYGSLSFSLSQKRNKKRGLCCT
jgi:methylated-DNA-[protein]-cysteine S-methyltransferase